jgi:uridine phosphorylase
MNKLGFIEAGGCGSSWRPSGASPEAIINPRAPRNEPPVSPRVILTFAQPDYELLGELSGAVQPPRSLFNCSFSQGFWGGRAVTVVAPAMGAPYAVMVLENLIALGARMVLALGWCGSLQAEIQMGALVLPSRAVSGDGTSPHYCPKGQTFLEPHPGLYGGLEARLKETPVPWQAGLIWTTDAVYRETPEFVRHCQAQGILAVEMEMAALFAVGQFRRVPLAGLLVVSDELFTLKWRHGYRDPAFHRSRELAARLVLDTAAAWEDVDV